MNLTDLQTEVGKWSHQNFGGIEENPAIHCLLGAMEELGELSHAHLKGLQSIRHTAAEIHTMKIDAIADVIIYLADYCVRSHINLDAAVTDTWAIVKQRDWKKNPIDAAKHPLNANDHINRDADL